MLYFTTHNYFLFTRKEFWFYNGEKIPEGTYNTFSATKRIYSPEIHYLQKYTTSIIDLSKTKEELFNAIHPRIRRYIRAAEKQDFQITIKRYPTETDCDFVFHSFNQFAKSKKIAPLNKKWLKAVIRTGNICFTEVNKGSTNINTHVYIFDDTRTIFTHVFYNSLITNERIRSDANQYLLWNDLLYFSEMGLKYYDFGGINLEKLPGISQFKLKFGGTIEEYYRYIKTPYLIYLIVKLYKWIFK
jgi:hypothetical protein